MSALSQLLNPTYPLGAEWLDSPKITPQIKGHDDFEAGCHEVACRLIYDGAVSFTYGCLSEFHVDMSADYDGAITVRVRLANSVAAVVFDDDPFGLLTWDRVASDFGLKDDDARAVTYLLRRIEAGIVGLGDDNNLKLVGRPR